MVKPFQAFTWSLPRHGHVPDLISLQPTGKRAGVLRRASFEGCQAEREEDAIFSGPAGVGVGKPRTRQTAGPGPRARMSAESSLLPRGPSGLSHRLRVVHSESSIPSRAGRPGTRLRTRAQKRVMGGQDSAGRGRGCVGGRWGAGYGGGGGVGGGGCCCCCCCRMAVSKGPGGSPWASLGSGLGRPQALVVKLVPEAR